MMIATIQFIFGLTIIFFALSNPNMDYTLFGANILLMAFLYRRKAQQVEHLEDVIDTHLSNDAGEYD
jgi:hypothetical protein